MMKITQCELDRIADIIWWIKGYMAADEMGCPFHDQHVKALELAYAKLEELTKEYIQGDE